MERIDRSGSEGSSSSEILDKNISDSHSWFPEGSYFYFMQICCQHLHGGRYNCANLKDRGKSRILKD